MYDKEIRKSLINFITNKKTRPSGIIEELPVHNGNAIADVVALYKNAHCYEIKGSRDHIFRAVKQGSFYNTSFNKITIVTTSQQLPKAFDLLPDFWGIIQADRKDDGISFKYIRKATINKKQSKSLTLQILWKDEMINIANKYNVLIKPKSASKAVYSKTLAANFTRDKVNRLISEILLNRSKTLLKNK